MALKGDLASVDLAQVFQMLALNKKVGLLSIQSPRHWRVLFFNNRGVTLYYNPHCLIDRVAGSMVRTGRLDDHSVGEARSHAVKAGNNLADSLLAGGFLGPEELEAQMRFELEEEIYDLFFCRDAKFEFHEGRDRLEGREGVVDDRFFFNTDGMIMEAARRIDEWSYISERITSAGEVFQPTGAALDESAEDDAFRVLELTDGRRTVSRIVDASGMSNFVVWKQLSQLLEGGLIEPVPQEHLVAVGDECLTEKRPTDAVNLYERAIAVGEGLPAVYGKAAAALETQRDYARAGAMLRADAEWHVARGDAAAACQRLYKVVGMLPTDLDSRRRLIELAMSSGVKVGDFQPIGEGKSLVNLLLTVGDVEGGRALLEMLLRVQPDDIELKKALVNVHTKAGDQKRVVELYDTMADDLVRIGRPLEAIAYLQKILMLDRTRTDVSARVRKLYEFDERSRKRRRGLLMCGLLLLLCATLGTVYYFYDQSAEQQFARLSVEDMLQKDRYDEAAAAYQDFVARFPLTRAVGRAHEQLARIDGLQQKFAAKRAADQAALEKTRGRLRTEYRKLFEQHREEFRQGDADTSLITLNRVRELVEQTGAAEDRQWAQTNKLDDTHAQLIDVLRAAERLSGEVRQQIEAGRYPEARNTALQLQNQYGMTRIARDTPVPVAFNSRPAGAKVLVNGQVLLRKQGDTAVPVLTPAVLMCSRTAGNYTIQLDGFESQVVAVDPLRQASIDVVLKVIANRRIHFPHPGQSGAGSNGRHLVVGQRGGKVGIANIATGAVEQQLSLGELRAVDSRPTAADDRVFFVTNEATLECLPLTTSAGHGWSVRIGGGMNGELLARDGRLFLVDRDNRLVCHEQGSGRQLWAIALGATPAGSPTYDRRLVRVASTEGVVILVDAATGTVNARWKLAHVPSTRLQAGMGTMYFGSNDGRVRAVDERDGTELWSQPVGRGLADGEIALSQDRVLVVGSDGRLLALDRATGAVVAQVRCNGVPQRGMLVADERLFVAVRVAREAARGHYDVLQVFSAADLSAQWEFVANGTFTGPLAWEGGDVLVPDADGDVVMFR